MLPHPTPVIEAELSRRAALIRREPWIGSERVRVNGAVYERRKHSVRGMRATTYRKVGKRSKPADYAEAIATFDGGEFSPSKLAARAGARLQAACVWLGTKTGLRLTRRVRRGVYVGRKR